MKDILQTQSPLQTPAWNQLSALRDRFHDTIPDLLDKPHHAETLSFTLSALNVDLSKHYLNEDVLNTLIALAMDMNLPTAIEALRQDLPLNFTESRAASHMQLRDLTASGEASNPALQNTLDKMADIANQITQKNWLGYDNQPITDIVNIGIGGSDLGPRFVCDALKRYSQGIRSHFISNIDPNDLLDTLETLNPATTLFIVSSKTFTTQETLANANAAKAWLINAASNAHCVERHFVAVSSKPERAVAFGVAPEHVLPMPDTIGGRYSLWSAIGLPIAISIGFDNFLNLLRGAQEVDRHFVETPLRQNIPALLGMLDVWYINFWNAHSIAVIPYAQRLDKLPRYLQQLTMESNGKSVDRNNQAIHYSTGTVFWGTAGTNGQHSYHQLFHQGTELIPIDLIITLQGDGQLPEQQRLLVANAIAQSMALTYGSNNFAEIAPLSDDPLLATHQFIAGNKPHSVISLDTLSPHALGSMIALYEHRVFTSSILWNINAFDQWGVELGKKICAKVDSALQANATPTFFDTNTAALVRRFQQLNNA